MTCHDTDLYSLIASDLGQRRATATGSPRWDQAHALGGLSPVLAALFFCIFFLFFRPFVIAISTMEALASEKLWLTFGRTLSADVGLSKSTEQRLSQFHKEKCKCGSFYEKG